MLTKISGSIKKRVKRLKSRLIIQRETLCSLLICAGILMIIGSFGSCIAFAGYDDLMFRFGILFYLVDAFGAGLIWYGMKHLKLIRRSRAYVKILKADKKQSILTLASETRRLKEQVYDDLSIMIKKKYLKNCIIDQKNDRVIFLSPTETEAAEHSGESAAAAAKKDEADEEHQEYERLLNELRRVSDQIEDTGMTNDIAQIESIAAGIFKAVEEDPEKLPKIRMFVEYYLPTTLKLLRAYARYEAYMVAGENIADMKSDIKAILERMISGYEKQLDLLFTCDMLAVTRDAEVLETMLIKNGLLDDELRQMTMQK